MAGGRADQVVVDAALVRRLVDAQFPHWSELPIRPVANGGWDNRTFRLGEEMAARLPSAAGYAAQVEKEQRWLPRLAPNLPLAIPAPLAMGEPGEGYPWRWSVYRWIEGETASAANIADMPAFAIALAEFLAALQRIDAAGGPAPGRTTFFAADRWRPMTQRRGRRSRRLATGSTLWPRPESGTRRLQPDGVARLCGSMAMSARATCW